VWSDGKLPADALVEPQLIGYLVERAQAQWQSLKPSDKRSLDRYKKLMLPAWRHTLQAEFPEKDLVVEPGETKTVNGHSIHTLHVGRAGKGDRLPVKLITPARDNLRVIVVLAHPEGKGAYLDAAGSPQGLAKGLLERNYAVVLLDTFLTGELANAEAKQARKHLSAHFSTYNRTDLQERVQDLITACAFARTHGKGRRVALLGAGRAGLWALLAAPAAEGVVADCDGVDSAGDTLLLEQDLFVPGLRRIGAFEGAAALAAPNPLLLHHTGKSFATHWLRAAYAAVKADYRESENRLDEAEILDWLARLKAR
jgi:dienelactone hydrolase